MEKRKKVIYCDGTFDLFHSGHVNFLRKCKSYGDYLIVGLISDKDVESYKRLPINSLENRKIILENISIVDEVVAPCPFNKISKKFIEEKGIDLVIYGSEKGNSTWIKHYEEAIKKNIMVYISYDDTQLSTTKIINKIKLLK